MKQHALLFTTSLILLTPFSMATSNLAKSEARLTSREPASNRIFKPSFIEAATCAARPEFVSSLTKESQIKDLNSLPKNLILVAKDAEYYVEGLSEKNLRIHSFQSFAGQRKAAEVLCGSATAQSAGLRLQMSAPTIIDFTPTQKIGNSLWSFQLQTSQNQVSAWNRKSPVVANKFDKLFENGTDVRVFQLSHDEFEIVISKKEDGILKAVSIRYDAISNFR